MENSLDISLEIFTDGACSGNPGEASIGVVIKQASQTVKEISLAIGTATNNIAEYTAVIYALQEALVMKASTVRLFTDSELLFKQVQGQYKVKNAHIKPLFEQVKHMLPGFKNISFQHIMREYNREADKLAKRAIAKKQSQTVALEFNFGEESPSSKG